MSSTFHHRHIFLCRLHNNPRETTQSGMHALVEDGGLAHQCHPCVLLAIKAKGQLQTRSYPVQQQPTSPASGCPLSKHFSAEHCLFLRRLYAARVVGLLCSPGVYCAFLGFNCASSCEQREARDQSEPNREYLVIGPCKPQTCSPCSVFRAEAESTVKSYLPWGSLHSIIVQSYASYAGELTKLTG